MKILTTISMIFALTVGCTSDNPGVAPKVETNSDACSDLGGWWYDDWEGSYRTSGCLYPPQSTVR
ncbi:hypothetical protein EKI60_04820 [Candidatus Saccharibacteria bacterium]|nr:MAG: hypothetical protein EKI60_04820 [Candidatus Saccharibacteria bacterium]